MSRMTYEQAFRDHNYLWETYGPAADMTGAYVDQMDLALLLRKPDKTTARDCLVRQILYWFSVGTEDDGISAIDWDDPEICEIADRHGHYQ
jgi:hypothetical protein